LKDGASPGWKFFDLAEGSEGVAFGLKSSHEVILTLDYLSPYLPKFEIALGAEKNSLTKLSLSQQGNKISSSCLSAILFKFIHEKFALKIYRFLKIYRKNKH